MLLTKQKNYINGWINPKSKLYLHLSYLHAQFCHECMLHNVSAADITLPARCLKLARVCTQVDGVWNLVLTSAGRKSDDVRLVELAREKVEVRLGDPNMLTHCLLYCNNLCARKAEDKLKKPKLQQEKYARMPVSVLECMARKQEVKTEQSHWAKANTCIDIRIIDKNAFSLSSR